MSAMPSTIPSTNRRLSRAKRTRDQLSDKIVKCKKFQVRLEEIIGTPLMDNVTYTCTYKKRTVTVADEAQGQLQEFIEIRQLLFDQLNLQIRLIDYLEGQSNKIQSI